MPLPTSELLRRTHHFLDDIEAHDARYRADMHRQSWIPDLFYSSQACQLVSEHLDQHTLPLSSLQQLLGMDCSPAARAMAAGLFAKGVLAQAGLSDGLFILILECGRSCAVARVQCTVWLPYAHGALLLQASSASPFQRVQSIRRPPVLLATPEQSTQSQAAIARLVHQAIVREAVDCNAFVPSSADALAEPHYKPCADGVQHLTLGWTRQAPARHRVVYVTDIVSRADAAAPQATLLREADGLTAALLGQHITSGFLLQHSSLLSRGVHTPSYFALFADTAASGSAAAVSSPAHNESHRCAAWHLLLRHSDQTEACAQPAVSSSASQQRASDQRPHDPTAVRFEQ